MSERAISTQVLSHLESQERQRIERSDVAYLVDFWNQDKPAAAPTTPGGIEIQLMTEQIFDMHAESIKNVTFLTHEARDTMLAIARRDYDRQSADDAAYIDDVNQWLAEHPQQVAVVTASSAHMVTSIVNNNGAPAPCVLDGWMIPRETIVRARLLADEA